MFRRILVANRGEVAARVIRSCKRLGIEAVAVATDADADLAWLSQADVVAPLGDRRAYLDMDKLLAVAEAHRCSAVHPGWGFLSENPVFASRCEASRISFIGPRPLSMRQMADKAVARATMTRLGLLPIPGTDGPVASLADARVAAAGIGYPVLIKAVSGGGGRGMRRVYQPDALSAAWSEASAEALSAFGDGRLYIEKLIERGRHVELQLLGDGEGDVRILGARECSVQRRHQKLVEEGPPPALSADEYARVAQRAAVACGALRYRGAGTLEMLQDADGRLWFMEMNTRLQVEHTVTEETTGLDLVEWQLRIAANQGLSALDLSAAPGGHAIECRINAEDPAQDFRPFPGRVSHLRLPVGPGLRVDTHLQQGDRISPHYDSMFAKIISHGATRDQAIDRMVEALGALEVKGVPTTAALHRAILRHPDFRAGRYDTGWLEPNLDALLGRAAAAPSQEDPTP